METLDMMMHICVGRGSVAARRTGIHNQNPMEVDVDSFVRELMDEPYWWKLGRCFHISSDFLNLTDSKYGSRGVSRCLREIFFYLVERKGNVLWREVYDAHLKMGNFMSANRITIRYLMKQLLMSSNILPQGSCDFNGLENLFTNNSEINRQFMQQSKALCDRIMEIVEEDPTYTEEIWSVVRTFISPSFTTATSSSSSSIKALKIIIHQNVCFLNHHIMCNLSKLFPWRLSEDYIKELDQFKNKITLGTLATMKKFSKNKIMIVDSTVIIQFKKFWKQVSLKKFERIEAALFQNSPGLIIAVDECGNELPVIQIMWSFPSPPKIPMNPTFNRALGIVSLKVNNEQLFEDSSTMEAHTLAAFIKALTNNLEAFELLLSVSSNPQQHISDELLCITNSKGESLLHIASKQGHIDIVKLLIEAGAKCDSALVNGMTPLILASYYGHIEVVIFLISKGKVDVNQVDNVSKSPLFHASSMGHDKIISFLLFNNADPCITTKPEKATCLMVSSEQGHIHVVRMLLERCINLDINFRNWNNATALVYCCEKGHTEIVRLLLQHGSDPNVRKSSNLETPLIIASKKGHTEIVKLLVKAKVDLNSIQKNGGTALYVAAEQGHKEVVAVLLEAGADPNIMRDGRLTPLLAAKHYRHYDCISLLNDSNSNTSPHAAS